MFNSISIQDSIKFIVILFIAIDLHEFAHAVTAYSLGDPTPKRNGQISLNPLVHMDQIAVFFLILSSLAGFPLAWGRTFIQPQNLKFGPQRGGAIVAAAGPLTNLSIGILIALGLRLAESSGCIGPGSHNYLIGTFTNAEVAEFFTLAVWINFALFVFNLIPLPPLDGFTIVSGFLTTKQMYSVAPLIQYGPIILLLLISLSFLGNGGFNPIGGVFTAVDRLGSTFLPLFPAVPACSIPNY